MKYLAYYDTPDNQEQNRDVALAATNKISYICSAIERAGKQVDIISASVTRNTKGCRGKTVQISESTTLKLFACMGTGILPKRLLGRYWLRLKLFLYLLFHIKKNEDVIVYHSLNYAGMVALLRRLKSFRLIIEVEEIYADITGKESDRKKEYQLFALADAYIFPAKRVNEKINTKRKPYTLICGSYQLEPVQNSWFAKAHPQNKIHCVYAGTFDPRKGGCQLAINAARYLSENYHVHILGFGSKKDTSEVLRLLECVSQECQCSISYDGCLQGEEYIQFLQCCQIGLSTQKPQGIYNDTSFPSKILTYMANGLQVVTVRIPVVEESAVHEHMHYYDEATPEAIAKAIMEVKTEEGYNSRAILTELDKRFVEDIKNLLEG